MGLGGRLGSGRQWVPWVHVDDLVGCVRYAIEHDGVRGPMNVTAPGPVRQRAFAKTLARVLGRPALTWVPALVLKLMVGELSSEVLSSKRVLPRAAEGAGYRFVHGELEEALREALDRNR